MDFNHFSNENAHMKPCSQWDIKITLNEQSFLIKLMHTSYILYIMKVTGKFSLTKLITKKKRSFKIHAQTQTLKYSHTT